MHTNNKDKVRNINLDIIKGIAIILVVVGHSLQFGRGAEYAKSGAFFNDPLFEFIYSFHMPLFMLISGYLFGVSLQKHSFKDLLSSRITRLLIPIFAWTALTVGLHSIHHTEFDLNNFVLQFFTKLWFLWAIFWCSLIVLVVHRVFKDSILIYLLILGITFILPDTYNMCLYIFMYPFFVIGYWFKKKNTDLVRRISVVNDGIQLGVLVLLYLVLMYFYNEQSYIYTSGYTLLGKNAFNQFGIDIYRFFVGLVGSSAVILSVLVYTRRNIVGKGWTLLAELGKASLGIYVVSLTIQNLQLVQSIPIPNNIAFILTEAAVIIALSYLIVLLLKRYKITNTVFLGGR